jgi:transposase
MASFGCCGPVHRGAIYQSPRFVRWRRAGVWSRIIDALAAGHDATVQMIDTSIVRVHQHGACVSRNKRQSMGNKIKQCRRVATRYDKLAANYLAFIQLASIRLWLRVNESTS